MKLFNFLKNYINSNNSLIFNEDFFENQKNDSENGAKTAEKSKEYAVSRRTNAQEGKSNNKREFLSVFKQSPNKEVQQIENKDYFRKCETIQKKVKEESAESESVVQEGKSNNKLGFLRAFKQSLNKYAQQIENKDYFRKYETIQKKVTESEAAMNEKNRRCFMGKRAQLHFLDKWVRSVAKNMSILNQTTDSEKSKKTTEKSKGCAVSAQREKSNNKRGFLTAFKQSLTPESTQLFCKNKTQSIENAIKTLKNLLSQPAFSTRPFENKRVQLVETGRSMVEILGVMAIIGVLTVGGISGYRFAMDKYRANDIVNEVSLRNRDTWNMYQTKDLPRVFELEEWTDVTQTGFPIGVYPRSNVMFDVEVNEVPSRICKSVLQLPIQGPLFIWTTIDETRQVKHLYHGNNPEICDIADDGTDEVSMVFTTTLETYGPEDGIRGELKDERGQPIRYCLEDSDCRACETCYKNDPYTCQSICSDDKPICMQKEGQAAKCVECELNIDCPHGKICDDTINTCQPVPEKCEEGTFRSRNGACVPCDEPTNIIISKEKFTAPGIEDEKTGEEMCDACATASVNQTARNKETDRNGIMYCSYGCTKGVSFQTTSGFCAPCYDENGNPSTEHYVIPNETEAKAQCVACPEHEWYFIGGTSYQCGPNPWIDCPAGTFRRVYSTIYACVPCDEPGNEWFLSGATNSSIPNKVALEEAGCNNCHIDNKWSSRRIFYMSGGWRFCTLLCEQPDENSEESTICLEHPDDPKCKRKFMSADTSKCLPCNYSGKIDSISRNYQETKDYLTDLCERCGRRMNEQGYCVQKGDQTCPLGQFMAANGSCVDCDKNELIDIESDEQSGCTANCKKKDGEYSTDAGAVSVREILDNKCALTCVDKQIRNRDGSCENCSTTGVVRTDNENDNCETICPGWHHVVYHGSYCTSPDCRGNAGNPTNRYYKNRYATCTLCNSDFHGDDDCAQTGTTHPSEGKQLCEACGNRIVTPNGCCRPLDPGTYGLCNNIDIQQLPEKTDDDLKTKAIPYLRGDYNRKLFLDDSGYCRQCTDKKSYDASIEQCRSCGNRRRENGTCHYALCTEKVAFENTSGTCVSCSIEKPRTQIDDIDRSKRLCDYCDEKRTMTSVDAVYCVDDCASGLWQDLNGRCRSDNVAAEIGTDDKSIELCRKAEHIAYSKVLADGKTHWYCSRKPEADKFIGINGALVGCNKGDTEIPDTNDARNLCLGTAEGDVGCQPNLRKIIEEEDKIICAKSK